MNDTSSFFIEEKALFGSYPTQEIVNNFIERGVKYFIDLTNDYEKNKLVRYNVGNCKYINFQIKDRSIPENLHKFSCFIIKVSEIIKNLVEGELVYIHCRGGHGRAGIVVSCLLCYIYNIPSQDSLHKTNIYHNNRKLMNDKWRLMGAPQYETQKNFVRRLFKPIFLDNIHNKNTYYNLNNNSNNTIIYNNKSYRNINITFYCLKYPLLYNDLINTKNYYEFKNIILNNNNKSEYDNEILYKIMLKIIKYKIDTYTHIKELLIRTFLRPIVYKDNDLNVGEILVNFRHTLYLNL